MSTATVTRTVRDNVTIRWLSWWQVLQTIIYTIVTYCIALRTLTCETASHTKAEWSCDGAGPRRSQRRHGRSRRSRGCSTATLSFRKRESRSEPNRRRCRISKAEAPPARAACTGLVSLPVRVRPAACPHNPGHHGHPYPHDPHPPGFLAKALTPPEAWATVPLKE